MYFGHLSKVVNTVLKDVLVWPRKKNISISINTDVSCWLHRI